MVLNATKNISFLVFLILEIILFVGDIFIFFKPSEVFNLSWYLPEGKSFISPLKSTIAELKNIILVLSFNNKLSTKLETSSFVSNEES